MTILHIVFRSLQDIVDYINIVSGYNFNIDINCGRISIDGKSLNGLCSIPLNTKLDCVVYESIECEKAKDMIQLIKRFEY